MCDLETPACARQAHLLASFDHPYVVRYYDSFVDDEARPMPVAVDDTVLVVRVMGV